MAAMRRPACLAFGLLASALVLGSLADASAAAETKPSRSSPKHVSPKVRVDLISEQSGIEPGATFWIGLRQRMAPRWHTYWSNPGDSGEPTTIDWMLPAGFTAGGIVWPHPERIPLGPAMSFGYSGETVLLTEITAPAGLEPGTRVTLRGRVAWLVCEKICIPEEAEVTLTLPVVSGTPGRDARGASLIAEARRAVPATGLWPASFTATADTVVLTVAATGLAAGRIADAWFYPGQWGVIELAAPQEISIGERALTVRMARGSLSAAAEAPLDGVLVIKERLDQATVSQAIAIRATRDGASITPTPGRAAPITLLEAVALALVGGLVLNLMPCVLPVLSIKVLSLVGHAAAPARTVRRQAYAYTAGVLASFGVVAGALLILRAAGMEIGWGFQLQSPIFVALLAYVFLTLGLSLSGVITLGGRIVGVGHTMASRPGYGGGFFTGALSTLAATPCTAPFMGVAVGFAVTQPAAMGLVVFESLGLGLALPYLVLALVPRWRKLLPKPGPWMERLKQLLAFPLYATVAWLVWVTSQQAGPQGVAALLAGLLLLAFGAWIYEMSRTAVRRLRRAAAAAAVLLALGSIGIAVVPDALSRQGAPAVSAAGVVAWEPFSLRRLAELQSQGKAVFVNFTAAWCITCLVNERVALRSPAVTEVFARKGVVYLRADWTKRDPEIARVLDSFGRAGVPLYLVYPPGLAGQRARSEPHVLPQILSEGMIIEALDRT